MFIFTHSYLEWEYVRVCVCVSARTKVYYPFEVGTEEKEMRQTVTSHFACFHCACLFRLLACSTLAQSRAHTHTPTQACPLSRLPSEFAYTNY